jgi:hypothetical protein
MSLYMAVLFFLLVPGVLVTLPPGGKKMTVAFTHAVVFALVYYLTHKAVYRMVAPYEAFQDEKAAAPACKAGKCVGGAKAGANCMKVADCQ